MELTKDIIMDLVERGTKYKTLFRNAKTPNDIRNIIALMQQCHMFLLKEYYNAHIGWALPTTQVCKLVHGFWLQHQSARVVDVGAGSGIFCMMFRDAGIPANKLLAIDKENPVECWKTTNTFWPIMRDDDFEVPIEDIFFMAWGGSVGGLDDRLFSYVKRGGWCVIILGEIKDGCTFPSDFFDDDEDWDCTLHHVEGPASKYAEHLSINICHPKQVSFF